MIYFYIFLKSDKYDKNTRCKRISDMRELIFQYFFQNLQHHIALWYENISIISWKFFNTKISHNNLIYKQLKLTVWVAWISHVQIRNNTITSASIAHLLLILNFTF